RLSPSRDRLAGFTQGLAQAGVTLRPEWALNGNAGLAGWNLVMLAPGGGLPSLLMAYRWQVTIGLGVVLASVLLTLRQAARARRKR
ncbi:hypothetical protein JZM00_26610, partial [Escherichia coli]|nr:hypothetical protein [Escherichia coli]